jgi:hypothetical protein
MKFSRPSLFGLVAGLLGLVLAPLAARAQQTITATSGQVGVAYSYQVTSSATPPLQWGATGLPAGLAINQSSGLITGTPTTAGTFVGNVSVTSNGQTNSAAISITIAAAPNTSVVTSPTTASGTVGQAFTYNSAATNSPTSYNITGLPSGLSANGTTGVISGTPLAAGTSSVSISANNAGGTGAAITLTLTVAAPATAPVITSATTASSPVNTAFNYTIAATNTPTSFAASGLPLGLSLDTITGAISGTPTVAGVYTIAMTATNAGGTSATVNLTLTVGSLASITSSTTATGATGLAFTYTVTASNSPTSFNITGLPAGLTANTTTGVISGTPTTAATSSINLSANNSTGTGPTTVLTLTVGNRPVITSATSASGTANSSFTYNITASNSPTSFNATGLPTGLSVNPTTGVISGTPTASGSFSVSLTASNSFGTGTAATLALTIAAPPAPVNPAPVFTSAISATGVTNVAFSFANTTSPAATSFSLSGNVPTGLSINATTGVISGTVTQAGTYVVTVTATGAGGTASRSVTLTFNTLPAFTTQPQSSSVAAGGSVTLTAVATGSGSLTYQWFKNGVAISGATTTSLALSNIQLADVGSYSITATNIAGSTSSQAAAVGIASTAKVTGSGTEVRGDIVHPNGNVYDQVLLTGNSATITADTGQVTRISFIDLNDDIVQVEFSGAGTLSLSLENPTGPATPIKYNQPDVTYMKGHASLVITGANETSNLTVFTVGTATAVNQALFPAGTTYDGIADIGLISIATTNGRFGGIRAANAGFFRAAGLTGISAPGVAVEGPTFVGDITADANATGVLIFGSTTDVRVTGGDLQQLNNRAIQVGGLTRINFTAGTKSSGTTLPAQTNRARFEQDGVDVTTQLVP